MGICAKKKVFSSAASGGLPLSFGPGLHRPRTERGEGAKAFLHGGAQDFIGKGRRARVFVYLITREEGVSAASAAAEHIVDREGGAEAARYSFV